jgi:hypothetical protein
MKLTLALFSTNTLTLVWVSVSFISVFSPNFDLKNKILAYTKDFLCKKMTQICQILKIFLFFFQISRFLMITSKNVAKNIKGFCILFSYFHI